MSKLDFYEVVRLVDTPTTRRLNIVNETGVILGIAEEMGEVWYMVFVNNEAYRVVAEDVASTKRFLKREDIYDGSSVSVDMEGNITRYNAKMLDNDKLCYANQVTSVVLGRNGLFNPSWLADKVVVPFPYLGSLDSSLIEKFRSAGQKTGYTYLLAGLSDPEQEWEPLSQIDLSRLTDASPTPWLNDSLVLTFPDFSAAFLISVRGFILLAGSADLVNTCVPEGILTARLRFAEYVQNATTGQEELEEVMRVYLT